MLRTHIPSAAKHKKMSKVDTLRHAVEYIQSLTRMLNRNSTDSDSTDTEITEIDEIKQESPISPPPEIEPVTPGYVTPSSTVESTVTESYESGYETSSYYSCNSMISPTPVTHSGVQPYTQLYNSDQTKLYNSDGLIYSNNSVIQQHTSNLSNLSSSRTFNYPDYSKLSIEPNSEEDELLDAIANWQDS